MLHEKENVYKIMSQDYSKTFKASILNENLAHAYDNQGKPRNKQLFSSSLYSFNIFTFFSLQPPQPHSFLITSQCKELLRACSPSAKCKFFIAVEKC